MTHEEAARILDPETSAEALREYGDGTARIAACDEACRTAADVLHGKHTGEALTMEQLREMGGNPVWIVEYPDWGHWELSEDGEDYIADRYPELYGLRHDDPEGRYGLHKLGWLAYAYPHAHIDREAWEPCGWCEEFGDPRYKLYAGYSMQKTADDIYEEETEELNYCPRCGRPLTPGAWAELEKRMGVISNG